VKLSKLLELIGSGSVLLVAGVLMIALGIAYGFSEATRVPYWASLGGIGLLAAVIGYVMIDRVSDETEEQVNKLPFVEALRSPLWLFGAAAACGIILARLTRIRQNSVALLPKESIVPPTVPEKMQAQAESSTTYKDAHGVSHFLGDQLRTLGTLAGGVAISLGMKALGIPPVEQLLEELLGGETEPGHKPAEPRSSQSDEINYEGEKTSSNGHYAETAGSFYRDNT
jgi:hypothetical protein